MKQCRGMSTTNDATGNAMGNCWRLQIPTYQQRRLLSGTISNDIDLSTDIVNMPSAGGSVETLTSNPLARA